MGLLPFQVEDKTKKFYFEIPNVTRAAIEGGLVYLADSDEALRRFSEIVSANDVFGRVENILQGSPPEKLDPKRPKFQNYLFPFRKRPRDTWDLFCACDPSQKERLEAILTEHGVSTRTVKENPCEIDGCEDYREGIAIPLCKITIYVPDEDLWDEEEVVPELVVLPTTNPIFRRFIQTNTFDQRYVKPEVSWKTKNTCQDHSVSESLRRDFNPSTGQVFGEQIFPRANKRNFRVNKEYYLTPESAKSKEKIIYSNSP